MIGKKILELRSSKGWTTEQLAAKVGVDQTMISKYETGKSTPRMKVILKLSKAFGIQPEQLTGDVATHVINPSISNADFKSLVLKVQTLPDADKATLTTIINDYLDRDKLRDSIKQLANRF